MSIDYLPFYVGKGCNNRVREHYMPSSSDNSYTKGKISKLKNGGHSPLYIVYNTNSLENDAYNEEIQCIKFIKEAFGNILTNLTDGGDNPPVRYGKDNHKSIPVF